MVLLVWGRWVADQPNGGPDPIRRRLALRAGRVQTARMGAADAAVAKVRQVFDTVADDYDQSGVAFFQPIADRLTDLLDVRRGERALDVGCGRGAVTRRLVDAGAEVTAIDLSPAMVGHARAAVPEADVREMDATRPDLPEGSFDVLASSLVLFFLPEPQQALTRWRELLAPGGRVGVTTFGEGDETFEGVAKLFEPYMPREALDPLIKGEDDPFASDESVARLFERAGAVDVQVRLEPLAIDFADVEAWRRWTMSTGQRMFWGRMDDAQRADVLAGATELLEGVRDADGRIVVHLDVRYTLARA